METKARILAGTAIAVLVVATAFTSLESRASMPSSPAERAATAELNRDVTLKNAAAVEQHRLLEVKYQEQQRQYEAQLKLHQAELQSAQEKSER